MTKVRVLFAVALMAVSSLAFAQDAVKKGTQGWSDLEKQLADINDQWVCAHKYHKDHAQDCVDFKNNIWPDTFSEISMQGEVTDKHKWSRDSPRPPQLILFLLAKPDRIRRTLS